MTQQLVVHDPKEHYHLNTGPTTEFGTDEVPASIKNIGWTLGNDCPYRCSHCYSMSAREKGRDLEPWMVTRIARELADIGVETVNLGGNEPAFTNGLDLRHSLLPLIIEELRDKGIEVGLTTSGVSLLFLHKNFPKHFHLLNDVDVSLDSPFESEHNENRGARLYSQALQCLRLCDEASIPHSIIMAAMDWNFSIRHVDALVALAKTVHAHVRINPLKVVEARHLPAALTASDYYRGFARLFELCHPVDLGEPPLSAVTGVEDPQRCPCGRSSFRIHSISPDGAIYVSPCVYLHDYKVPLDLLKHSLRDIVDSPQFQVFRRRNRSPGKIDGCAGCELIQSCGGGCAARSFLDHLHNTGLRSFRKRDPYCPKEHADRSMFPNIPVVQYEKRLVHMDYLCTWIGTPK